MPRDSNGADATLQRAVQGPLRNAIAALALGLAACSGREPPASPAARGEEIYKNVCATCHGPDPSRDGTVGPAIAGASRELLEAKILRGEYPPGYRPRREGAVMPKLPHLADYVGDLAAYLQASGASPPSG
jgi:mono/diheme cytochrome c family protein